MTKFYNSTSLKIGENYIEYLNDEPLWICQYIGNDVVRILKTFTGCKTPTATTYWRSQYKMLTNLEKDKILMSINISDLKVGDIIVYQAYNDFNSKQMEPALLERIINVNKKYIRTTTIKVLNIHWQSYLYEQTTYDYFNFKSYCRLITDLEKIKYL